MEYEKLILSTADYVIFAATLVISTCIGLYFRFAGGHQKNNEEFLLAGRNMSIFPVAFSLMATFMAATTLMGIPAEMYLYGTNMTFMNIGFILGPIIAGYIFLPVYFDSGVTTTYEYLEKRFGKTTRRILSAIFIFQNVLFNAVTLYAPALALSAVTNLSMWISIVSIGIVCTFYCTLAGMRAVLWTDVFQAILMFACLLAIIIKGSIDMGSIANIISISNEGGRLMVPSFSLDLATRYTFLSVFLQGAIITTTSYGCSQIQVQRMLTLKNIRRSKIAAFWSIPMVVSFQLLCCLCGLLFYAYFRTCDPMTSPVKPIHSADQLMPFYITATMSQYPGVPGLCISGIFSASLSTVSSSINSLAAVTWGDLIHPFYPNFKHSVTVTKTLTFFYGALSIVLSFFVASLGNLVKASVIVVGMILGPTLGIFLLGTLSRRANEQGAILGVVSGVVLSGCLTFLPAPTKYPELPVSNECPEYSEVLFNNGSYFNLTNVISNNKSSDYLQNSIVNQMYTSSNSSSVNKGINFSFMWISPFSLLTCLVVGYTGSIIAGYFIKNPEEVPSIYISPIRRWFFERNSMNISENENGKKENIELKEAYSCKNS